MRFETKVCGWRGRKILRVWRGEGEVGSIRGRFNKEEGEGGERGGGC